MAVLQSITQAFMRPIEINDALHGDFNVDIGGTPRALSGTEGVYGCILPLVYAVNYWANTYNAYAYLNTSGKVVIYHASSNVGISTLTEFSRVLGFTETIAATTTSITAQQTPLYCWFPTHHSYDGSRWWRDPTDRFKGGMGPTGGQFGVTLPSSYRRNFSYSTNYSANTYDEAERDYYTFLSVDYFPASERAFEAFIDGAITAQTNYSDSGNVSSKGVYYIDRAYEYFGLSPTRAIPRGTEMLAGGIHFDLDDNSKRDNFVFCQVDPNVSRPAMTNPKSASYYEPQFTLVTDDTPDTVAFADDGER